MKELIKITQENGKQAVSARDLHEYVVKQAKGGQDGEMFAHWIKRMLDYGFEDGLDYEVLNYDYKGVAIFSKSDNQHVSKRDYVLSLDCAKEIAMIQNNDKGKEVRKYFIELEKQRKPMSTLDMVQASIDAIRANERDLAEVKHDIVELKAKTSTRPDYFTIVGYGTLNNVKVNLKLASKLGRAASRICKTNGYAMDSMPDPRFGKVKLYPKSVLDDVFSSDQDLCSN